MKPEPNADAGASVASSGHWAVVTKGDAGAAAKAMRELAASYWYPVFAWWRRAGCNPAKAASATEACFSRWIEREPPRETDPGGTRMREWLLQRLPAMAVAGVKPWATPLITVDREWGEKLYATEAAGSHEDVFTRRLAIEMLEFGIELLREEYTAAGRDEEFRKLFPRLRIVAGEEHYPAVEKFRQRFRTDLRALVADILSDPRDVESEIAALLRATKKAGGGAALPAIFDGLTPEELFAWGLATPLRSSAAPPPAATPRASAPAAPAPLATPVAAAVAPAAAAAIPVGVPIDATSDSPAKSPKPGRPRWIWIGAGTAALLAATATYFALRPPADSLSIAEKAALAREAERKTAPKTAEATPTPKQKPAATKTAARKPNPTPEPAPAPAPPQPAMVAATPAPAPQSTTAPTPAPAPEPVPMPAPAAPALSEFAKWLATTSEQMQAAYDRDVRAPFDAGVAKALQQYVTVIDTSIAAAGAAGKRDVVLALRAERQRVMSGRAAKDDGPAPAIPELKPLRAQWRTQFAKLDRDRFDRAKALHARFDPVLAAQEARFAGKEESDDARALKERRAEIAAAWLVPPVGGLPASTSEPAPSAQASKSRLAPPALVARLLAMRAKVFIRDLPKGGRREVKIPEDVRSPKFEFLEVEFRARSEGEPPATDADLELLDDLSGIPILAINGIAVSDASIERLRSFRGLEKLRLENLKNITPRSIEVVSGLTNLHTLALINLPVGDEAAASVAKLPKLTKLQMTDMPVTGVTLAAVAAMPGIEDLEFGGGKAKVPAAAWECVASMRKLNRLVCRSGEVTGTLASHLARCSQLSTLSFNSSGATDAAIAPLAAMTHLATLSFAKSKVTGAAFKTWPARSALTKLYLDGCPGLNDGVLRAIAGAFPKLETLEISGEAGTITPAGAGELAKLRNLATLRLSGEAANDAIATEFARIDSLAALNLGHAKLTDAGLAALARLPKLTKLDLVNPPITDGALRALKRFRALKEIHVGTETQEAIYHRLRADLPGVAVYR